MPTIEAWASWTNANGGIAGRPVKLIVEDDQGNAATALSDVKRLVEQDHVVAIVSEMSNSDTAWASYVQSKGIPVVGGNSLDLPFLTNPDFFPAGTNLAAMEYGLAQLAAKAGPKFAVGYCAEAAACAGVIPLLKAVSTGMNLQVVYSSAISGTAIDYTAFCQAVKNSGAQSYDVVEQTSVAIRVTDDCAQAGMTATVLNSDGTVGPTVLSSPSWRNMQAVEADFPYFDSSTPAEKIFQDALTKYALGLGNKRNSYSAYAWASGLLFAQAVKDSHSSDVTPESVKQGLYKIPPGTTLDGLTPPLGYTEGKATAINCYFEIGTHDGKFVAPQGLRTTCAPDGIVNPVIASFRR